MGEALEEQIQGFREGETECESGDGRNRADHRAFDQDGTQHLTSRGAERAKCCELARALGDRHRDRVEDDEGADEQRDPGESEEDVAEDRRRTGYLLLRCLRL